MFSKIKLPEHLKNRQAGSGFRDIIPVRVETFNRGAGGDARWAGLPPEVVRDANYPYLCKFLGFEVGSVKFDLPSSFRGVGSYQSGSGGSTTGSRIVNGFVLNSETGEPIAKLTIIKGQTKFGDYDPDNESDFFNLERQ